ncbi:MAG: hypothetical protein F4150_07495 [Chloroflexi bacterium]|nr:hypothetical protein [Chloroflexota bacterium]
MKAVLKWLASLSLIERETTSTETKVVRVKFGVVVAIALSIAALVIVLTPAARDHCIQLVETVVHGDAEVVQETVRTIVGDEEAEAEPREAVGPVYDAAPAEVQAAIAEFFPRDEWENAAAIALCESGFRLDAHNLSDIEDSRGLWQINVRANADMLEYDLWSARGNAHAAAIIFERQGWAAWKHCATGLGLIKELSHDRALQAA